MLRQAYLEEAHTSRARDGSAADASALSARLLATGGAVLEAGEPVDARRGHWGSVDTRRNEKEHDMTEAEANEGACVGGNGGGQN